MRYRLFFTLYKLSSIVKGKSGTATYFLHCKKPNQTGTNFPVKICFSRKQTRMEIFGAGRSFMMSVMHRVGRGWLCPAVSALTETLPVKVSPKLNDFMMALGQADIFSHLGVPAWCFPTTREGKITVHISVSLFLRQRSR